ncbi:MAG: hypothetical protein U5K74_11650 [Gemmatimonadaceae bacterium]|nr:hypothetical protein [Gemmatimonadaceae bacterium]
MQVSRPTVARAALCALLFLPSMLEAQSQRERERERQRQETERRVRTLRISIDRRERTPDREITMSVGALRSDDDDRNLPMAALRTDWRLRRWLRSELGVSYAIGTIDPPGGGLIAPPSRSLQLASATVGLRAELPASVVRPYVGIAAGLALRDEEGSGTFVRTTMAFPAGLRILLSDRVSLRAEARARFDQRRAGGQAVGIEQTGGLSVAF